MKTPIQKIIRFAGAPTVMVVNLLLTQQAHSASLQGHVLPVTAKSQLVGPFPASQTLNLAIALPLRNQDELRTLLEQLYDPASPLYHHFLTPDQFADRFGPTKEDYALGGPDEAGTIFRVTTNGLLTTVHAFHGLTDGLFPRSSLLEGPDGYFYGATSLGGTYNQGTIFRMGPSGLLTTLVHFDGFNGGFPRAGLVQGPDGSYYGTTINGGAYNAGTIFG